MSKYRKFIILELLLCVILGCGIIFVTKNNEKILQQQDRALYYVNISGKQRVLAQRIVFLSQIIATNYVLKRDNTNRFAELRSCISELMLIHNTLQNFVIAQVVGNNHNSTLDDVYFGSGDLSFKMEAFLEGANRLFALNTMQEVLQVNQMLLTYLEGENGLLAALDLATLSQQIYGQSEIRAQEERVKYYYYAGIGICILEALLLMLSFRRK